MTPFSLNAQFHAFRIVNNAMTLFIPLDFHLWWFLKDSFLGWESDSHQQLCDTIRDIEQSHRVIDNFEERVTEIVHFKKRGSLKTVRSCNFLTMITGKCPSASCYLFKRYWLVDFYSPFSSYYLVKERWRNNQEKL